MMKFFRMIKINSIEMLLQSTQMRIYMKYFIEKKDKIMQLVNSISKLIYLLD